MDEAEDELFGDARGDEPDPEMTDPGRAQQAVKQWLEELERVKRRPDRLGGLREMSRRGRKQRTAAG